MTIIYAITVNFNSEKETIDCVTSLQKLSVPPAFQLKILVVNNSDSTTISKFKNKFPMIPLLQSQENLGFAQGVNTGIEYALSNNADYIFLINNDTVAHKNLLLDLLKEFEKNKNAGIASPKVYFAKGFEFHKQRYSQDELGKVIWYAGGKIDWKNVIGSHRGVDEVDSGQYDKTQTTDFATGCCMLIKREVLEQVGLFDKRYYLYYEDADFSERVKKAKFEILYVPTAVLWHKNASSAGGSGSSLQDYFISRNRLLFGMTYAPLRAKLALLREAVSLLFNGRQWQKKAVNDFFKGNFGRGSFR